MLVSGELASGSADSYAVAINVSDGSDRSTVNFPWEVRTAGGNGATERFDFESSWQRWKRNAEGADTATTGQWARANPQQTASVDLSAFVGSRVRLLIQAADAGSGSLVEAGIDEIVVDITR